MDDADQPPHATAAEARAKPRWIADADAPRCMLWPETAKDFWKLVNPRHHCRYCGWAVCGTCCPDHQMLPVDRWVSSTKCLLSHCQSLII
jgi:hypothetical protein